MRRLKWKRAAALLSDPAPDNVANVTSSGQAKLLHSPGNPAEIGMFPWNLKVQ